MISNLSDFDYFEFVSLEFMFICLKNQNKKSLGKDGAHSLLIFLVNLISIRYTPLMPYDIKSEYNLSKSCERLKKDHISLNFPFFSKKKRKFSCNF